MYVTTLRNCCRLSHVRDHTWIRCRALAAGHNGCPCKRQARLNEAITPSNHSLGHSGQTSFLFGPASTRLVGPTLALTSLPSRHSRMPVGGANPAASQGNNAPVASSPTKIMSGIKPKRRPCGSAPTSRRTGHQPAAPQRAVCRLQQ